MAMSANFLLSQPDILITQKDLDFNVAIRRGVKQEFRKIVVWDDLVLFPHNPILRFSGEK